MTSLAARDQENLVNTYQTAAASKPLNQGLKGLQPKTPGNKPFQTPFKAQIHDENASLVFNGLNNAARENQPFKTGGKRKQVALVTPAPTNQGPRNALAPKTTNVKAKTPNFALMRREGIAVKPRSGNRPPSLRKFPREDQGFGKLDIPASTELEDAPSSPEIEYMPPKATDLPDIDDELPPLDLSGHKARSSRQIIGDIYSEIMNKPIGPEGLSRIQMEKKHQGEVDRIWQLREEAEMLRNLDATPLSCLCEPECASGQCKEWAGQAKLAEESYRKTMAGLLLPHERAEKENTKQVLESGRMRIQTKSIREKPHPGPSDAASRRAASSLSMRNDAKSSAQVKARDYPRPWLTGSKAGLSNNPHNGHASRHAAAVAASRTTLGFKKGRTASSDIRHIAQPEAKSEVKSQKTETEILQEMWTELKCREDEETGNTSSFAVGRDVLMEDAKKDFVLEL